MTIDEILAKSGALTDEEVAFVERELVKATRELHALALQMEREVARSHPRVASRLRRSADSLLTNVEKAASLPWPNGMPGALAD